MCEVGFYAQDGYWWCPRHWAIPSQSKEGLQCDPKIAKNCPLLGLHKENLVFSRRQIISKHPEFGTDQLVEDLENTKKAQGRKIA